LGAIPAARMRRTPISRLEAVGDGAHGRTVAPGHGRGRGACDRADMRLRLALVLLASALAAAACGGSGGTDAAAPADAAAAAPEIVAAEPVLEEYRGGPLAIVFFHPL
ncbi:MAG: hypothetical protein RL190_348, partial [Actinomycetota bacterium]